MIHIITKLYKHFKNHWEIWVIIIIVLMILKGIISPFKRIPSGDTILIQSDSLYKSVLERDTRFQILLNSIQLHQGLGVQREVSSESLKMQGRLLFITLFSALITVLFSSYKEQYRFIVFTALLVGFFWYGININKLDIENRGLKPTDMIYNTELKLLNIPPEDNRLYSLDLNKWRNVVNKDTLDHKIDKIKRFITPDFEDIVFNMMPLLILAILYSWFKKHTNSVATQADQKR